MLHRSQSHPNKAKKQLGNGAGVWVGRETITLEIPNSTPAQRFLAAAVTGKLNELQGFHYLIGLVIKVNTPAI